MMKPQLPDDQITHEDPSCTRHGEGAELLEEPFLGPCHQAELIVHGERQEFYGHPLDNWTRTVKMWSVILGVEVTIEQAMDMMVALKIARNVHRFKDDNWVDIAGYVEVGALAKHERDRRAALDT
jgi:hypothetical protein